VKSSLINLFARHRVAANLLMMIMFLSGAWALFQINTQFLPTFHVNYVTVNIAWPGANAEDIDKAVTMPLEEELRDVDHLKKMSSTTQRGRTSILLEFMQGSNMSEALDDVKQGVSLVRNLPADSDPPVISRVENYEPISHLLITSKGNLQELRPLVYRMERQLLDQGIAKIRIIGLPDQEISIQIPAQRLVSMKLSLSQIAQKIAQHSQDIPAGTIGKLEVGQELRSISQQRSVRGFQSLPIVHDDSGRLLRLGDIAHIERRSKDLETHVYFNDKPAVEMVLFRTETGSSLKSAKIMREWLKQIKPSLPEGVVIQPFFESWKLIQERTNLLLKNAGFGLVFILIILFLFLSRRVATWVAAGIPASFAAAIAILYAFGGSINMVSLFAMIMTLGIIVDDTIVVGEEILTQLHSGKTVFEAVRIGTKMMLAPIMAASLTTVCAFFPLLLVGGVMGQILRDIPFVVICVIIASLIECFLVLPGHLNQSYRKIAVANNQIINSKPLLHNRFEYFKEYKFRPFVSYTIHNRWSTLSAAIALLLIALGLVFSGHLKFVFFPDPPGTRIHATAQFTAGTPSEEARSFLTDMNQALWRTNQQLSKKGKSIVVTAIQYENRAGSRERQSLQTGEEFASMNVELISPDKRKITNEKFIASWRHNIKRPVAIENLTIKSPRPGPPGEDVDIELTGNQLQSLKYAANELEEKLSAYQGTSDVQDDLPYGKEHLIFTLKPQGHALGLTVSSLGKQLRAAFSGEVVQIFYEPRDEVEVRVMLPDAQRHSLSTLDTLPIVTTSGSTVPLQSIARLQSKRGFDVIKHINTKQNIRVTAKVDSRVNNANRILENLQGDFIPSLEKKYNVQVSYAGRAEEQANTFKDMRYGLLLALIMIYIILAWVFASYTWPFLIMIAIPIGLTGAIFGHLIMGINLTILSLFGFFGLSGIVINDSIILMSRYRQLKRGGMPINQAIIEASCQRLRPVILTSMTTIAGLLPLLFETSMQAQFLIPMAVSISFGLAYATVLVLIVIPSLIHIYEGLHRNNSAFPQ